MHFSDNPGIQSALSVLAGKYDVAEIPEGVRFHLPGYDVDLLLRSGCNLVVAFAPRSASYPHASEAPAWGEDFLRKEGVSACHVRPKKSCWYLGPDIQQFMKTAADCELFHRWHNVMTYGGSMGGFAALAYARTVSARRVLSMNPQLNLGPEVRDWEDRFPEALSQDWSNPLCNINNQVAGVETLAVVYDPYHRQDRKQVDLLSNPSAIRLKIPFVGHMMATHMKNLKVLIPTFRQVLSGSIDTAEFYKSVHARRNLLQYQSRIIRAANGKRRAFLNSAFVGDTH